MARDLGAPECAEAIRRSNASRELVGQVVLLTGLTAKGDLNGRRGVALSYEARRQRLRVRVRVRVRVRARARVRVRVRVRASRPQPSP